MINGNYSEILKVLIDLIYQLIKRLQFNLL